MQYVCIILLYFNNRLFYRIDSTLYDNKRWFLYAYDIKLLKNPLLIVLLHQ